MKTLPFLIPALLILVGFIMYAISDEEGWIIGGGIVGGVLLFMALLSLPLSRFGAYDFERQYFAMEQTIEEQRAQGATIESAALTIKVVEINQKIASIKFWNETMFDWYWPDRVANLKPLK